MWAGDQGAKDKVAQDERSRWGLNHTATGDNGLPTHSRGSHLCQPRSQVCSLALTGLPSLLPKSRSASPGPAHSSALNRTSSCFPIPSRLFFPTRDSSEPTGFCGRMLQGRVHTKTRLSRAPSWPCRAGSSPDPPASTSKRRHLNPH